MSTLHHTDLPFGFAANAAVINVPFGQLDQAIEDIAAASSGWAQTLDGTASSGQKVVPVASTTGAVVGMPVFLGVATGNSEVGVIASVQAGVSVTMTTNLTYTYSAGAYITATPYEVFAARAAYATLAARLAAADAATTALAANHALLGLQMIAASGTYTPTSGAHAGYVECVGGGGGGGGVATAATNSGAGGGGGGGGYSALWIPSLAVSYPVTIGAGGPGGTAGANPGTAGGDTSLGSAAIVVAKGGGGGIADTIAAGPRMGGTGGAGGVSSVGTGDMRLSGGQGTPGLCLAAAQAMGGAGGMAGGMASGGASARGSAGASSAGAGLAATGAGGGGGGGVVLSGGASVAGGNGSAGIIRIWEYR